MIALVTTNAHKVSEAQGCLALLDVTMPLVGVSPTKAVAETGLTFAENAQIKLEAALQDPLPEGTLWVVAEDAGLIIEALDETAGLSPFPGVQSDRWLTEAMQRAVFGHVVPNPDYTLKNQAILALMASQHNRQARYEACLALYHRPSQKTFWVTGTTPLTVAMAAQGQNGFGYDPIMIPCTPGDTRTLGERLAVEKNRLSHRLNAWQQVKNTVFSAIVNEGTFDS